MAGRTSKPIDQSTYAGRFAARLRYLRKEKRLSVEEAAAAIGVEPYTLYRGEEGRREPAVEHFPAIAAALGCKLRNLLPEVLSSSPRRA